MKRYFGPTRISRSVIVFFNLDVSFDNILSLDKDFHEASSERKGTELVMERHPVTELTSKVMVKDLPEDFNTVGI